jgi:hypothetical protein
MKSYSVPALPRRWHYISALLTLLTCCTAQAQTVLVSNLAEPLRGATPIGNNPNPVAPPPPGGPWYWGAQSFQSDNQQYRLASIDARVGDGSMTPLPTVVAELHADSGGTIGALITTFTAPSVLGAPSARTFTPNNAVTLQANAAYWFVLGSAAPGDGTYFWQYAEGDNSTGPGSLGGFADTPESGVNWTYSAGNPFFTQVNVNPIAGFEWNVDALGDWTQGGNWSSMQAPNTNVDAAVFGGVITAPRTVVVDSAVTVKGITFDNAHKYAIAGTGAVNLESDAASAALAVVQGTHELQVRVNLSSDVDASIAAGAALEFNNRLNLGGHTLTKTGAGAMQINNDLNLGGGSIVVLAGSVGGGGAVGGDLINASGTVAPGNSPGALTVNGDFAQAGAGALAIELAGPAPDSQHDQLKVSGHVALGGALEVSLINGFAPSAGQAFDLLDWGTLTGVFSTINLPVLPGLAWNTSQLYTTGVLSVAPAFEADFDEDGDVDGNDLTKWKTGFGASGTATHMQGDADADADVDGADFLTWQRQFGSVRAVSSSTTAATGVPEPTTAVLLLISSTAVATLLHRH